MNLFLTSVILELDLAPSRKTKTFFLILLNETHRVPKLQLNTMSAEKAFCINQYLLKVISNEQGFGSNQRVQLFKYRRCSGKIDREVE